MASTKDYIDYVSETVSKFGLVTSKKMFGEYMIYINAKPIILVCDNTVYIKMKEEIKSYMNASATGYPYEGAKLHYILDTQDEDLMTKIMPILERITDLPKKKIK